MYDHDGRDYTDDAIRMEKGQTRSNGNEYQRRIHIYSSPWLARYVPELEAFVDALTRSNNSSIGTVGGEFKDDNNYGTCDGKSSIEEEAKKHKAASIGVSVSRMFTELTARSSPAEKIYKHFQVLTSFQR